MTFLSSLFSRVGKEPETICLGTRWPFGLGKVRVPIATWERHQAIFGKTGKGKSSYMISLALDLIHASGGTQKNGHSDGTGQQPRHGVVFIDPHGDAVSELIALLASYPKRRPWLAVAANRRRVIYIDPRSESIVPFNPLVAQNMHPYVIAQSVIEGLRRVWYEELRHAPRAVNLALFSLLVLIENKQSLMELPRLLTNKEYRDGLLAQVTDEQNLEFWHERFEQWSPRERPLMIEGLLNKATEIAMNPYLSKMMGAPGFLNPREVMDSGRIVLVNLAGDSMTKNLLGALLLSFFEQAALSREDVPKDKRRRCYLIIDEAQKFTATEGSVATFGEILSECRKYGLSLIFGTQGYDSMMSSNRLAGSLEQVGLLTTFGTGRQSAQILAPQMHQLDPEAIKHEVEDPEAQARTHPTYFSVADSLEVASQQIQRLKSREILVKLPDSDDLIKLKTPTVPKPRIGAGELEQYKRVLASQYGCPRQEFGKEKVAQQEQIKTVGLSVDPTGNGSSKKIIDNSNTDGKKTKKDNGKADWKKALWQPWPRPVSGLPK